ncbi:MAG TPA: outer membrane beta-barrel protein [Elusimicrobiales bacterium]|nr:outer membrane beta-barrel protein [Elusimicrobiales bacterium]
MKKMIKGLLAALIMLGVVSSIKAELTKGNNMLILQAGAGLPITNEDFSSLGIGLEDEKAGKIGPAIGVQYLHQLSPNVAVGGDFLFNIFSKNSYSQSVPAITFSADEKPQAFTIMPVLKVSGNKKTRPYLIMGIGFYHFSVEGTILVTNPVVLQTTADASCSGLAFMFGGGVDFDINETMFFGIEGRWNNLITNEDEVGWNNFAYFNFLAHIGFRFGS